MKFAAWELGKHGRNSAFDLGLTRHAESSSITNMTASVMFVAALLLKGVLVPATDPAAKPSLIAQLENPKIADDAKSMTVDFVLFNQSDKPVIFAERWNSWGAYQWHLTLQRKDAQPVEFTNPQQCWTMNFLSVVTLEPGRTHRSHCLLRLDEPSPWPKGQDVFTPAKGKDAKFQDFKTASSLSGLFMVEDLSSSSEKEKPVTNWVGEVATEKVEIPGK